MDSRAYLAADPGEAIGGLLDWVANIAGGLWTILSQLIDSLFTFIGYQFGLQRASDWVLFLVGVLLVILAVRAILRRAVVRGVVLGFFGVAVLVFVVV